jgi:hypothetical protein
MPDGFRDLLGDKPTWRDIIVKALGDTELDCCMWSEEVRAELADHILAAMRKATVSGPL